MLKKNETLRNINSAAAQLSSAQLSSAQLSSAQLKHHFKLFSSLCLLINYKILFCLRIKKLFKFFFEFIKFQFAKSIYLFKCFYKYLLNGYNNPKGFLSNIFSNKNYLQKFNRRFI